MEMNAKLKNKKNIILTFQKLNAKPFIIKCLLYPTDTSAPKAEHLGIDDITILSLKHEDTEILTFKPEIEGDYIYIFNVVKTNDLSPKGPNIVMEFIQKTKKNNHSINIENVEETNGNDETII